MTGKSKAEVAFDRLVRGEGKESDEATLDGWIPVEENMPPAHETVLAQCTNGDIYQTRVCYGMHEPWWCGHSELNFGIILSDKGLTVESWRKK